MLRRSTLRAAAAVAAALVLLVVHASAQDAPRKHFLWKVEGRKTPLYLLGSIHLLSSAYYPLPPGIYQAFESAGTLIEEINLDELTSSSTLTLMMSKALYQDGKTLDQALSRQTYERLTAYLQSTGMPIEPMKRFKPWMVGLTISALEAQKAGFDPNLGIDKHFFEKAKKDGKTIDALETAAYQIERLDELVPSDQDDLIRQTLGEIENERANLKKMADAWAAGDVAGLEKLLLDGFKDSPRAYQRLLVERNVNWMPTLDRCLDATTPCFVVVGAAHLVGPDGLISMLRKKGLTVDQR
jgi:uncharacterized protein YbaP (TraB family)